MAQNPQQYSPALMYVSPISKAWTTTGNTDTVTDEGIDATTQIVIMNTSAYAGRWYVSNITPTSTSTSVGGVITVTPGTFTITSSSSETQTTTTYKYTLI